jgi:hypothetical protein
MFDVLGYEFGVAQYTGIVILFVVLFQAFVFPGSSRIKGVPGPKLYALTKWRLAYDEWKGNRTRTIHELHQKYGTVVRVGPNELSFNSLSALKTIYGAGSGFERTSFYRMFDAFGHPNLFSFASVKAHSERKKLLNHAYSKTSILKINAPDIEKKAWEFLKLLESQPETASETFYSSGAQKHSLVPSQTGKSWMMCSILLVEGSLGLRNTSHDTRNG